MLYFHHCLKSNKDDCQMNKTVLQLLRTTGFCVLLFMGSAISVAAQQKEQSPNVIYIYADDMGYGELGSYGQ